MKFEGVCESFFQLEQDLNLFEWNIDGIPVWELVRYHIFHVILQALNLHGQPNTLPDDSLQKKISLFLRSIKNYIFYCPCLIPKHSIIIIGRARRSLLEDGLYWDIYSDYLVDISENGIILEPYYLRKHLIPAKTKKIFYADLLILISYILERLIFQKKNLLKNKTSQLLKNEINNKFGIDIDIDLLIYMYVKQFIVNKSIYINLFKIIKPKACIILVSYRKKGIVSAAKSLGIPTIELQHGLFTNYDMGYSFPGGNNIKTFPDYFFTFGEYWKQGIQLPISENQIYNIGYPHLDNRKSLYANIKKTDTLIFISQGTIGKALSQFAVNLRQQAPKNIQIIYKLHPGEYDRWQKEYPWLIDSSLEVIDSHASDLYELFARSKWQVGVYSTAIIEGLAFGCNTYLVNLPGVTHMQSLINFGYAQLVDKPSSITFKYKDISFNKDYFFKNNWKENFQKAISDILSKHENKKQCDTKIDYSF